MKTLFNLTKRNLLMFFRSKSEVFFSFLAVIIIIGLYVLFIADLQVQGIEEIVGPVEGAKALVNSWVMGGLIAASTVTLSLGALGRIVGDREKNAMNDFLVAPVSRSIVFLAYVFSALIITLVLSLSLFIIAEIYIVSSGGELLGFIQILQILGIIVISVLSSSLLMLFIVSFLKNTQVLGLVASITGTLIGFIAGAYIPIGMFPKGIQIFSSLLPVSQSASLFRKVLLEAPMEKVFGNTPYLNTYANEQGVNIFIGKFELTTNFMVLYIVGSIILFVVLNIIRFKKMKNN